MEIAGDISTYGRVRIPPSAPYRPLSVLACVCDENIKINKVAKIKKRGSMRGISPS